MKRKVSVTEDPEGHILRILDRLLSAEVARLRMRGHSFARIAQMINEPKTSRVYKMWQRFIETVPHVERMRS